MKNKYNIFVYIVALGLSPLLVFTQNYDAEFEELLKNLDLLMTDTGASNPPAPAQTQKPAPSSSAKQSAELPKKTIPVLQKKDPKTDFLESFQEKEGQQLPSFKKDAAKIYLSSLLSELLSIRHTIASTEVYRRTKLLASFGKQLSELEAFIWEILNNDAYLPAFFLSAHSSLRNVILDLGKELSQTNRSFRAQSSKEQYIGSRAAFEKLKPEQASFNMHLKKLSSLLQKKLPSLINDLKSVIQKSGANIEAVKKKNLALVQDAEKFKKEVETKAASYRPAETVSSSFWDSPYSSSYSDQGNDYYGDGGYGDYGDNYMNDFFGGGGNFPTDFEGEKQESPEQMGSEKASAGGGGRGGNIGGALLEEGEGKTKKLHLLPSTEELQKNNNDKERELKEEIIVQVENALAAFNQHNNFEQAIESIKPIQENQRSLGILESILTESRKNGAWKELDARYQGSVAKLKGLIDAITKTSKDIPGTEKIVEEIKEIREKNNDIEQEKKELRVIETEEDIAFKKAIDTLRPHFADISTISTLILKHNNNNALHMSKEELEALQLLTSLSNEIPHQKLYDILRYIPLLIRPLNSIHIVLKTYKDDLKAENTDPDTVEEIEKVLQKIHNLLLIIKEFITIPLTAVKKAEEVLLKHSPKE